MPDFRPAPDLERIARKLVRTFPIVGHITVDGILFLRERETMPKGIAAKCYKFGDDHPWNFFEQRAFCIVVYENNCRHMSKNQITLLVLHELMHIGLKRGNLRDHTVKDFRTLLGIDLNWSAPGVKVPDILKDKLEGPDAAY